jgi:hypothetical protein
MRFGTSNVRNLYRAGSLTAVAWGLVRHKLDLVGVQDKGGTVRARDYNFFYRRGIDNHHLGTGFFVHHKTASAVKKVHFFSDRVSYIVLIGR